MEITQIIFYIIMLTAIFILIFSLYKQSNSYNETDIISFKIEIKEYKNKIAKLKKELKYAKDLKELLKNK